MHYGDDDKIDTYYWNSQAIGEIVGAGLEHKHGIYVCNSTSFLVQLKNVQKVNIRMVMLKPSVVFR